MIDISAVRITSNLIKIECLLSIAGPGFHEEKKYMLGPDADIEKILDSNMNDMCEYNLRLLEIGLRSYS